MDGERNLSVPRGQQFAHMHPFIGGCLISQLVQKSRGEVAESIEVRDRKRNEADVGETPHPLRALLELGFLSTTGSDVGTRGAINTEETGYHGIKSKFEPRMPW
jgi:hypothetical protein